MIEVPEGHKYVAINRDATMVFFVNPPVKDLIIGIWKDPTDGTCGTISEYKDWDTHMRDVDELNDYFVNNVSLWLHKRRDNRVRQETADGTRRGLNRRKKG